MRDVNLHLIAQAVASARPRCGSGDWGDTPAEAHHKRWRMVRDAIAIQLTLNYPDFDGVDFIARCNDA